MDQQGQPAPTTPTLGDLAAIVRKRRESLPAVDPGGKVGLSVRDAARRSGMSAVTWSRVENGEEVRSLTYAAIESVLRWTPGSIRVYLDHGVPPTDDTLGDPTTTAAAERKAIHEFEFDELLSELRRRYLSALESRTRHLGATGERGVETAASVEARGMLPGLPMPEDEGDDDVAEGTR